MLGIGLRIWPSRNGGGRLRETLDAIEPVSGILDQVVIEKRRTDFIEFAVYSPIESSGVQWVRHFSSVRLLPGAVGAPDYTIGTLAYLYATTTVPIFSATGGGGISAASPTTTVAASAATRTGTWVGPSTISGVANSYYTATPGDTIEYTISCTAGDVVYSAHPSVFSNGGVVAVSVAGLAAGDYLCPLVGAERLFSTRQDNGTLGVAAIFRAPSTASYVVTMQLSTTTPGSSRLYTARLEAYAALTGTSAPGSYGSITVNSNPGENCNLTYHPGHTFVIDYPNCTRIDFEYWRNTTCGQVDFAVYDSTGSVVTGLTNATLDMYGSALATSVEVMSGKPLDDYSLHVFLKNTKNASSTDFRLYFIASVATNETEGGTPGTDTFNILDMPSSPTAGSFGTHTISGPGNHWYASQWRPAAAGSWPVGDNFVGGVHGEETSLANTDITVTVDGSAVAWNAAAVGATFIGQEIVLEFSTTLNFPGTATPFATLERTVTYTRGGQIRVETTRTLTADATMGEDYNLMLQAPNGGDTQSDGVGGGFDAWIAEGAGTFQLGTSGNVSFNEDPRSELFACWNGEYVSYAALLNPTEVETQYAAQIVGTDNILMTDLSTHLAKAYLRSAGGSQPTTGAALLNGHVSRVLKLYRTFPADNVGGLFAP